MHAFLFPGQGSQYVGMGKELAAHFPIAKDTFHEANEILHFDITSLCFEGPEDELRQTKNTQPAILIHSVAALRILHHEGVRVNFAAGHSLGEYSAHVAAGSIAFAEALETVRLRGELMYESGLERPGTMAALVNLPLEQGANKLTSHLEAARALCEEASIDGVCQVANDNSPQQVVISGDVKAVQRGMKLAVDMGAKAVALPVSGAFHSELMATAKAGLAKKIEHITIEEASFPIITNLSAQPVVKIGDIRYTLIEQLDHPVRWVESMQYLIQAGVTQFAEVGPGKVLTGLMRRIERQAKIASFDTAADYDNIRAMLR